MRRLLQVLGGVLLYCSCSLATIGIELEDKMETEIDLREPRSFSDQNTKILSIRPTNFERLPYNKSGVISYGNTLDSSTFGRRYWYETRDKTVMCPSTPIGIATQCDWALMIPCLFTGPNPYVSPRTIFVHTPMLPHFVESTLKFMNESHRFVLLSGGSDATIPRSLYGDHQYRGFTGDMGSYWGQILNDKRVIHWFCENVDQLHPKVSALPTAFVSNGRDSVDDTSDHPDRSTIVEISKRPLKFIVSDKVRSGTGTWADRQTIMNYCEKDARFCYLPGKDQSFTRADGVPHKDFLKMVVTYPFIACVHGAGIDPSPKAWESLLVGTIPIIQHSTVDDAYARLPVMFVNDWSELFTNETEALLKKWLTKLAPYYEEGSELRKQTLHRLSTQYWVDQARHKYHTYMMENFPHLVQHHHGNHSHPFGHHHPGAHSADPNSGLSFGSGSGAGSSNDNVGATSNSAGSGGNGAADKSSDILPIFT